MSWENSDNTIIKTPKGDYLAKSDDCIKEFNDAATWCGFTKFRVKVNGTVIESKEDLQTNSLAALKEQARIEGIEPTIEVGVYNKPA
uniref:Uncharacterized protein n=1 Tax=viral metagenome TaxID=1070528 RepID=A0A6M3ISH2_9ZZZZ